MKTSPSTWTRAVSTLVLGVVLGCSETRNLGSSSPHGLLPVDERNPILLTNDSFYDNWQGEYAIMLANTGGPKLAGIIVGTSPNVPVLDTNVGYWQGLIDAARASGLDVPDLTRSDGAKLVRPDGGHIEATVPNRSGGAQAIVDLSKELSL